MSADFLPLKVTRDLCVSPWGIHSWSSSWPRPQPPSLLLGTLPPASPRSLLHPLCSLTVTVMHRAQAGPSPLLLSPQSHWVTWCNPLHTGTPTLLSPNSLRIPRNLATTQHLQRPSARGTRRPHRAQHLLSRPVPSSGCSGQNLHFMEFIETLSLLSRE